MRIGNTPIEDLIAGQREVFAAFHAIERQRPHLIPPVDSFPVDLNSYEGQQLIRIYCWRAVEEFYEAQAEEDPRYRIVELADVLTFTLDLFLITGLLPDGKLSAPRLNLPADLRFIYALAAISHGLRNRPWKRHPSKIKAVPEILRAHLFSAVASLISYTTVHGHTPSELVKVYGQKKLENLARIRG